MNACPRGLCDGSGLLAPHPATMSADAGLDDPCPCRDVALVSMRTAAWAWAEVDRLEAIAAAKRIERRRAENADYDAHYDVDLLRGRTENEYGPRPVKVPT